MYRSWSGSACAEIWIKRNEGGPLFLTTAQEALRPSFHNVLFALNAEHARALMRSVGAAVSVVMVDLSLAKDNGFDLIAEFHRRYS